MKQRNHLLLTGALAIVAAVGLGACNNGGDNGDMSMNTQEPQPQPQPEPRNPSSTVFGDWVHGQFDSDTRQSDTAAPTDVGDVNFKFNALNDPSAFNDLLPDSGS